MRIVDEEHSLAATAESIGRCRDLVERACLAAGATEDEAFALKLAVDEAVSNIVEHGYAGRGDGRFRVRFEADDEALRVVVRDEGTPFDPTGHAAPDLGAAWNEREEGGLGLHLMRQVLDEVRYSTDAAGNRLVLVKRRHARPGDPPGGETQWT